MKTTMKVLGGMMLTLATGYGAWTLYKKMNPECSKDIENMMCDMKNDMKKEIKDMM